MRWRSGRRSNNVEDVRGQSGGLQRMGGGFKLGGWTIILALIATFVFGVDPKTVLSLVGTAMQSSAQQSSYQRQPSLPSQNPNKNDESSQFVSVVLADTEDVWNKIFSASNQRYRAPKLVLFTDSVRSACGFASAASGPFYCPGDQQVYLDLSFFRQLRQLGASGDFAAAYVIAHEIGHHVQTILGTSDKVRAAQARASQAQKNAIQVKMELQADCLAGLWAHHAHKDRKVLEQGDIEEGLSAAAAVGDDNIMKSAGRRVHPESFTHGSSEQRKSWFMQGFRSGQYQACDTFSL